MSSSEAQVPSFKAQFNRIFRVTIFTSVSEKFFSLKESWG